MTSRMNVIVVVLFLACVAAIQGGCGADGHEPTSRRPRAPETGPLDPRRVQAANMSFADRYLAAMADEYDRAHLAAKTADGALMAQRLKGLAGIGALGNAVDPNPLVGLMDMVLMVTLTREIAEDEWTDNLFGKEVSDAIVAALKGQEADIWRVASTYLAPAQIDELHRLARQWRAEHPTQRYVAGARLADFAEAAHAAGGGAAVEQLAGSALGLVSLDPFHGLDPAVKEVAESRVLAERLFFYLRHMPVLMSWQADALFEEMLARPQMVQLFNDTSAVADSTTRFSDATSRFSDASAALAKTVENFRLQLPDQQTKLVADLDAVIARQRSGAMTQATTQVSVERDATLRQLGDTVTAQQDLLTRNLQGLTDQSIDRVFGRARALVLITVGSVLLALVLYRAFAARFARTGPER